MNAICLDIETRASQTLLADPAYIAQLRDSIEAPSNWKDPLKIEAHKTAGLEKAKDQMALHWFTGEIVAVAVAECPDGEPVVFCDEDEATVLKTLTGWLWSFDDAILAGFNVREFDLPWVTLRCAALKEKLPAWWPTLDEIRYSKRVVDARDALPRAKGKLDDYLRAFGLPMKSGSGADVATMTLEEIAEYAEQDIRVTKMLIERLAPHFRSLRECIR